MEKKKKKKKKKKTTTIKQYYHNTQTVLNIYIIFRSDQWACQASVYGGIILAKAINVKYENAHNTKTNT